MRFERLACRNSATDSTAFSPAATWRVDRCGRSTGSYQPRELATSKVDHSRVETAVLADPSANVSRIIPQHIACEHGVREPAAIRGQLRGDVKAEDGSRCGAYPVARKHSNHQCACREADTIDDNVLAGNTRLTKSFNVFTDQPAAIASNPQGRVNGRGHRAD